MNWVSRGLIGGGGAVLLTVTYWFLWPEKTYEDRYASYLQQCIETKDAGYWRPSVNVKVEDYCAARATVEVAR